MPHIVSPISYVAFFVVLVKVISLTMALILLPISCVKLFIVEVAFSVFPFSEIFFPYALVLVASLSLPVCTDVKTNAISQIGGIYLAFVDVSIRVMNLNSLA